MHLHKIINTRKNTKSTRKTELIRVFEQHMVNKILIA